MNNFLSSNNYDAEILVIGDPLTADNIKEKRPLKASYLAHFAKTAKENGFQQNDFAFLNCAPMVPFEIESSKTKTAHFIKEYQQQFLHTCAKYTKKKLILTMGSLAPIPFANKQVQITKVRGQAAIYETISTPVFHTYSMGYVQAHPGNQMVFEADFKRLARLKKSDYSLKSVALDSELDYQWCTDLEEWLDNPPKSMAVDTEGTGLDWFRPEIYPFTVQFCRQEGSAIVVPIAEDYYPELPRNHKKLIKQVRQLLGNPSIRKACHNIKYDYHMLKNGLESIEMVGPYLDTQQLMFNFDENIKNKALAECVRLLVPEMAGYDDEFSKKYDKAKMIEVPKEEFVIYAGSDPDAVFRLAKTLVRAVKKNPKQWFLFENVQMPGIMAFADTLEHYGVPIDECQLRALGEKLDIEEKAAYTSLMSEVPAKIKRKHIDDPKRKNKPLEKTLSFGRSKFVIDILFTREGFNLKPKVFTKGTRRLKPEHRVPSTSGKMHLTHFKDFKTPTGFEFINVLMNYQKLQKMQGTYVGQEGEEETGDGISGFWKYIQDGIIRPSYFLSGTVTGRSSSRSPNGQNFNKRGPWAKDFLRLFVAPPGYKLISADYSQAELRIAAWEANEPRMLEAYKNGEDIHAITGAYLSGLTLDRLYDLPEKEVDLIRFKAKGSNFGLIYGSQAKTYMDYAYTNYNVILTLEEAEQHREAYFDLYKGLIPWHKKAIETVHKQGYIDSLHGARRHLPDIFSTDEWIRREAERQAINSKVQRFGSDLGVIAITRLARDLKLANKVSIEIPIEPRMFIHDALVFMVPDHYVEQALPAIKWYMENNPLLEWFGLTSPVPIIADIEVGQNLAELSKRKDVIPQKPDWFTSDLLIS